MESETARGPSGGSVSSTVRMEVPGAVGRSGFRGRASSGKMDEVDFRQNRF